MAKAIGAGERANPNNSKLVRLRDELAGRHQRRDEFAAAHAVLDTGLLINPAASLLWRRKGVVHYYEHAFSNAYAALAMAIKYRQPLRRVIHVRGGALAEWGNYGEAIRDFSAILDSDNKYQFNPASMAQVRSSRAYALAKRGDSKLALREFKAAEEVTPDDSWLHYFRGLCYLDIGKTDLAIEGLTKALTYRGRHLNLPKKERAQSLLRDLDAPVHGEEL